MEGHTSTKGLAMNENLLKKVEKACEDITYALIQSGRGDCRVLVKKLQNREVRVLGFRKGTKFVDASISHLLEGEFDSFVTGLPVAMDRTKHHVYFHFLSDILKCAPAKAGAR